MRKKESRIRVRFILNGMSTVRIRFIPHMYQTLALVLGLVLAKPIAAMKVGDCWMGGFSIRPQSQTIQEEQFYTVCVFAFLGRQPPSRPQDLLLIREFNWFLC